MCLTSPSTMLSAQELNLLPHTMKYTKRNSRKHHDRQIMCTEIRGLVSLIVAMISNAAITSIDESNLLYIVEQFKRFFMYLTVAIPTLVMVHKVVVSTFRRCFLNKLVSQNSVQAANRLSKKDARTSSAATTLSQLSDCFPWKSSSHKTTLRKCRMSSSEVFVSRDVIATMTLLDVTTAIRYARQCNRPDLIRDTLSPLMKAVADEMDRAACESRGADVGLAKEGMDAIMFCAAMRIFAEWRMVRQVPEGYKGYASGMNLGRRDLIQNIGKIEVAAHSWLDSHDSKCSPSLEQLLQHEVHTNVHSQLPRLKDHTAAIGLLWAKRQMHYQASIYTNLVDQQDSQHAVRAAYKEVFDSYHGWFVQQIFQQSFRAAPPAVEIYKVMNPHFKNEDDSSPLLLDSSCSSFDESSLEDDDDHYQEEQIQLNIGCNMFGSQLWDKAGKHIQGEFGKILRFFVRGPQCLTSRAIEQHDSLANLLESTIDSRAAFAACRLRPEAYVEEEITRNAHKQIHVFLDTVQPVLTELTGLLEELNMNDPTKV